MASWAYDDTPDFVWMTRELAEEDPFWPDGGEIPGEDALIDAALIPFHVAEGDLFTKSEEM